VVYYNHREKQNTTDRRKPERNTNMKKRKNETLAYMDTKNWVRISNGGTAGIFTNGTLYVMCNGMEWFVSRTPNANERYAKGWATMLPAMKFADSKKK